MLGRLRKGDEILRMHDEARDELSAVNAQIEEHLGEYPVNERAIINCLQQQYPEIYASILEGLRPRNDKILD